MESFRDLGAAAQFRRLTAAARRALAAYDLGPAEIVPVRYVENAVYRVRPRGGGEPLTLRVHAGRRHSPEMVRSELAWLEALAAEDGTIAPAPVRTREGQLLTIAEVEGVPEPRICTLTTWISGRRALRRRSPALLRKVGAFMADLHSRAEAFRIPLGFVRPTWDYPALTRRDDGSDGWERLTRRQRGLFTRVTDRLRPVMERIGTGPEAWGLIHGDLVFLNLLFHQGEVRAIDFDDCGFGHYLYDVAILLDHIESRPDYPQLRAALLEGYRERRGLPPEHETSLDPYLLARWVYLGLGFLSRPEPALRAYAPRFLAMVEPKLEQYLAG